jgi:hypothetical protein
MNYELLAKVEREVLGCTVSARRKEEAAGTEQVSDPTNYTLPV